MRTKNVNPELYTFLKENETGLYSDFRTGDIIAFVHIRFSDLSDFVELIGQHRFDEGGMDVVMFQDTVCIEINDIIEGFDHCLCDYKDCFDEYRWKEYEEDIIQQWA